MMVWLIVILASYFFYGLFSFADKLLLSGTANAKSYTFYVGILNTATVVLVVFSPLVLPEPTTMAWILLDAVVFLAGLYAMFLALEKFEVSRVVPTIGALQPISVFLATWLLFGPPQVLLKDLLAFLVLLLGTFIISREKSLRASLRYWMLVILASFFFSLDFVFSKEIFLEIPFLQGLIWTRLFMGLFAACFLFSKSLRQEVFARKKPIAKQSAIVFVVAQSCGAVAGFLQSFAISLVPVGYLGIMNSLRGVQYVFLFVITVTFSKFLPSVFKETLSRDIFIKKLIGVSVIITGLAILLVR